MKIKIGLITIDPWKELPICNLQSYFQSQQIYDYPMVKI